MDDPVKAIAELLNGGGNAALLFLVFIGWRAANAAREVAGDIRAMRATMDEVANISRATAAKVEQVDQRLVQQELRLAQLVARQAV